jgi:hypothetical protein
MGFGMHWMLLFTRPCGLGDIFVALGTSYLKPCGTFVKPKTKVCKSKSFMCYIS